MRSALFPASFSAASRDLTALERAVSLGFMRAAAATVSCMASRAVSSSSAARRASNAGRSSSPATVRSAAAAFVLREGGPALTMSMRAGSAPAMRRAPAAWTSSALTASSEVLARWARMASSTSLPLSRASASRAASCSAPADRAALVARKTTDLPSPAAAMDRSAARRTSMDGFSAAESRYGRTTSAG